MLKRKGDGRPGGTPVGPWRREEKGRTPNPSQPAFSALLSSPPAPLQVFCQARLSSQLTGGGPQALHYTTGLHPEKRLVSCKIHFEATF